MTKIARYFWHCAATGEKWDDDKIWKPARPDLDDWVGTVKTTVCDVSWVAGHLGCLRTSRTVRGFGGAGGLGW